MPWRYEFISPEKSSAAPLVLDSDEFQAIDAHHAKIVLATVMKNTPEHRTDRAQVDPAYRSGWARHLEGASDSM
jgi:hypothetical protein